MEELQRRENREGLPPSPVEVSQLCINRHQRDKGGGRRMSDCPNREERTQDIDSTTWSQTGKEGSAAWASPGNPQGRAVSSAGHAEDLSSTKKVEKLDIGQISPP